jgi:N-methylhydantoinase B
VNGKQVAAKARIVLQPGDTLTFETPGGGGFGPPAERSAEARTTDTAEGYTP